MSLSQEQPEVISKHFAESSVWRASHRTLPIVRSPFHADSRGPAAIELPAIQPVVPKIASRFSTNPVILINHERIMTPKLFSELGLSEEMLKAIDKLGL